MEVMCAPVKRSTFASRITILDAPSNLGLKPPSLDRVPGVWQLPHALRAQGLLERLNASDAGEVSPPDYSPEPDMSTGFRNGTKIAAYSQVLAKKIISLIKDNHFPLILGGDCSILLGSMLALRALGSYGLCFIDGHDDFAYPKKNTNVGWYAAAGLDLGLVTGHGPGELVNIDHMCPYVDASRVVAFGFYNDPADALEYETEAIYQTKIKTIDINEIHAIGARNAAFLALDHLRKQNITGYWIHLDADVLDQTIMPAVDSPNPKGLRYSELVEVLRGLLSSGAAIGMEITIFDPEYDPDGQIAAEFVSAITQSFQL